MVLQLDGVRNREELHAYLAKTLKFPAYYGKNLAALHDCLGDVCAAGVEIRLKGEETFRDSFGAYGQKVLAVFAECGICGDCCSGEIRDQNK